MRVVVKVGGAQLEVSTARNQLAVAVRDALQAGHQIVLVHGGGDQMRSWSRRLGIEDHYHDGLRVTDAATAEVALAVLGGLVNRQLVAALEASSIRAVGLTGADGSSFLATPHAPDGAELGFVGRVSEVNRQLLDTLLEAGFVPVLGTVAPLSPNSDGDRSHFYNINADMAVGPLARALEADAVLFLTDVPGVRDGNGEHIDVLTPDISADLHANGALEGGMLPKVQAALATAQGSPELDVVIASAAGDDAVMAALEPTAGTRCVAGSREARHG